MSTPWEDLGSEHNERLFLHNLLHSSDQTEADNAKRKAVRLNMRLTVRQG